MTPQWHTGHDPLEGMTADGMITTGAARHRIPRDFQPVVAQAIERVAAIGGNQSLYLYGSVATGTARTGSSDVDLVTFGMDAADAQRLAAELSAVHASVCRGVDIGAAQLSDHERPGDEAYGNRVFLRHYCVHLTGPVVACHLPSYPADAAAARGFNGDIGACAERWRAAACQQPHAAAPGRRIARKTLLAVTGLVSIHDTTWTTDRVSAARRWGVVRPALAPPLEQLVAWSDGTASPSQAELAVLLDGAVRHVVDDFRRLIGLWDQPARAA